MITPAAFQKKILHWFDQHGRKNLPWQKNITPYRVWISEIMLQQTQVKTVLNYYERFITRFPNVSSLAKADQDDVLHLWAGLGYYSRARNIVRAAEVIETQYNGEFPDTVEEISSLPGIGLSTAGAISAIAFKQRAAILDGNVKRVLTRIFAIEESIAEKKTLETLWHIAKRFTPHHRVADYTQAIMDLGATICTRNHPNCVACPFTQGCLAFKLNRQKDLPKRKTRISLPQVTNTFLILKNNSHILLQKRPSKGIWGGLWSLPEIQGLVSLKDIAKYCREHFSIQPKNSRSLNSIKHAFTHYRLELIPILVNLRKTPKHLENSHQIWYNLHHPIAIGIPKPIQTLLESLYVTND